MGARWCRSLPLPAVLLLCLLVCASGIVRADVASEKVCTCRCCYQGGCSELNNVSWVVDSCADCTNKLCNDYIRSSKVRTELARIFESISGDATDTAVSTLVQECEVISVLEAATCTGKMCKRTSTIKAECYNRNAPLMKYSIISFVMATVAAVLFGLMKNYIPAFQTLNEKYFNY
ncbi:endochitinase [Strigomonas culicis]|uniref:Endochitinase n=1 Tax=Strigomonas culicis TaxID=28005 RepID=S9UHZ6_9TRYP|nr:endochitinase [Strigomonas culicis]EPY33734.1 endochitinase [Strigomonas culicis]|eukprot:EPY28543.1 endochitinase [Strigomonas culicis]